ncbi:MAG: transcription termination/antitermination protein NusA [Ruminococcaceae bacterium]|nr:transcription termination/antitermination protein NusA [Oscillospiraceae bacterium]
MNKEFFVALQLLEKEKGIPQEYMIEKIEAALVSAFKKEYGSNTNVRVHIDPVKEDVRVYQQKEVVEVVEDPGIQISLEEAKAISKRNTLGKIVEFEVKPKNFRRLSAGAAKSVIIQGIREGEHKAMQEAYESKREEIITATVDKVDYETGAIVLNTGTGRAVLPRNEQIPGEYFQVGDKIKVFIQEVNKELRGPLVTLSRVHPGFVRRMFELEIPEITDGIVVIKGVSREAGSRTKISVYSRDESVDAVGACIGAHGMRIESILSELGGEKIDIVKYSESPEEYVTAALSPATVLGVEMDGDRFCRVTVAPEQLSLAIGKEGQNVRLAARLTGIKIDINAEGLEKPAR